MALLRTPCSTPRSVSFSLPNVDNSGSTNCPRRPSAPPPRSSNVYYVNEEDDTTPRADDPKRDIGAFNEREDVNNVIHYVDVEEDGVEADAPSSAVVDYEMDKPVDRSSLNDDCSDTLSSSWETKKASFVLGSEAGSSARSSSRRSSFRHSAAGSTISGGEESEDTSTSPATSGHKAAADDLALIHILHIDDAPDDTVDAPKDEPCSLAITRF